MGWTGRAGNNANVLESKGQKEGEESIRSQAKSEVRLAILKEKKIALKRAAEKRHYFKSTKTSVK